MIFLGGEGEDVDILTCGGEGDERGEDTGEGEVLVCDVSPVAMVRSSSCFTQIC